MSAIMQISTQALWDAYAILQRLEDSNVDETIIRISMEEILHEVEQRQLLAAQSTSMEEFGLLNKVRSHFHAEVIA